MPTLSLQLESVFQCHVNEDHPEVQRPPVTNAVWSVTKSPQGTHIVLLMVLSIQSKVKVCWSNGRAGFPEALLLSPAVELGLVISMSESGTNFPGWHCCWPSVCLARPCEETAWVSWSVKQS